MNKTKLCQWSCFAWNMKLFILFYVFSWIDRYILLPTLGDKMPSFHIKSRRLNLIRLKNQLLQVIILLCLQVIFYFVTWFCTHTKRRNCFDWRDKKKKKKDYLAFMLSSIGKISSLCYQLSQIKVHVINFHFFFAN